jgi:GTP pyrophosphokinase
MVPLRTQLRNGDIVEIVRNASHKPSRDWLSFAVTSRARNKIKHLIQGEEKERAIELGRRVFDKEARRFGLNPTKLIDSEGWQRLTAEFSVSKADDVLAQIGYGKVSPRQVLDKLVPQEQLKEQAPEHPVLSAVKRAFTPGGTSDRIKVRGVDDLMVFRARCCNPIRGEKIVGYITRGKGVSVHSASCANVVNLMYDPERQIDVEWDKSADAAPYTVRLTMEVEDRKGILAELSAKIAGINTNITNMEATTGDRRGRIEMTIEIKDLKHLEKVIKSIRGVEGVLDVERAVRS